MSAALYEVLTFGHYGPASARRRLWVSPGRGLPVSRQDILVVYVDRVNDHEQVVFSLHGPSVQVGGRRGTLALTCLELNFEIVARAICRRGDGRVRSILVEFVNLQLKAQAAS